MSTPRRISRQLPRLPLRALWNQPARLRRAAAAHLRYRRSRLLNWWRMLIIPLDWIAFGFLILTPILFLIVILTSTFPAAGKWLLGTCLSLTIGLVLWNIALRLRPELPEPPDEPLS